MFTLKSKIILTVALLAVVGGIFGAMYFQNKVLRNSLVEQSRELALTSENVSRLQILVSALEKDRADFREALDTLSANSKKARGELDKLNKVFASHDLSTLAKKKPGLIQNRVNSGSARALRLLECETGGDCGLPTVPAKPSATGAAKPN